MKNKTFKIRPISLALLLAGIGMAQSSFAVDLVAIDGQWSPDGGTTQIPMWGFASDTGQACGSLPTWTVGPQLTDEVPGGAVVAGGLTINLRNCLSESVSIVIPGQPATLCNGVACAPGTMLDLQGRTRVTSFTTEAAVGGSAIYTWANVKPGTYLYQSGSHPAKQVQMGLYGALTVGTYLDTSGDVTMLYSEIDPALHSPPAAATPLGYHPRHYLVNGSADQSVIAAGDTNHPTVLRFLNAGLDFHVPALNGSYMSLVAEDGNLYPFAKQQYSVSLAAGKTIDALWDPASAGDHVIYDRRGNGMVAKLSISDGGDIIAPVITLLGADPVDVAQGTTYVDAGATATDNIDGTVAVITTGLPVDTTIAGTTHTVTYTATDAATNTATATRTVNVIAADITPPVITLLGTDPVDVTLNGTYTDAGATATDNIDGDLGALVGTGIVDTATVGVYTVTYTATDAAGNTATLTRTVNVIADNIAPVITLLGASPVDVTVGDTYTDAGATATDNIDGDLGTLVGTGIVDTATAGVYTVTYTATDAAGNTATLTRTVNVVDPVNIAPVAADVTETTTRNTALTFNLASFASDVDGTVNPGSIIITTGSTTTRGGTVTVLTGGNVEYTPKKNFRGTDTFNYTVQDDLGAESNEATVRVNVVK